MWYSNCFPKIAEVYQARHVTCDDVDVEDEDDEDVGEDEENNEQNLPQELSAACLLCLLGSIRWLNSSIAPLPHHDDDDDGDEDGDDDDDDDDYDDGDDDEDDDDDDDDDHCCNAGNRTLALQCAHLQ